MIGVLGAIIILLIAASPLVLAARRQRRVVDRDREIARRRVQELASMPSPDDLYKAPDLKKGTARKFRGRQHPVPRKRQGRQWGS